PQQLRTALPFRAQETLPIPLEEAVLDHRVLDDRVGEDGVRVCRGLLVVAHKELVERYVGACRKAGLKLLGIDLEAFALLRALSDPDQVPGEDAAAVCVSIGHDRSTLAVSDGRVCEFTRVLAWGGSALDAPPARVLDSPRPPAFSISPHRPSPRSSPPSRCGRRAKVVVSPPAMPTRRAWRWSASSSRSHASGSRRSPSTRSSRTRSGSSRS